MQDFKSTHFYISFFLTCIILISQQHFLKLLYYFLFFDFFFCSNISNWRVLYVAVIYFHLFITVLYTNSFLPIWILERLYYATDTVSSLA